MAAEWKELLPASDLRPGNVLEISHEGVDLLVFRTQSGTLRAMDAYCPHMRNYIPNGVREGQGLGSLLDGEELICPFHNWRFDGLGRCTSIPSGQRVPSRVAAGERIGTSWPLREAHGVIQIGAPTKMSA
jgi:phenylpropionate dioxygenase-like ring-hydroxylating dioxygenase large terminal subunit